MHGTRPDDIRVFLVGVRSPGESHAQAHLRLQELESLVTTLGMIPVGQTILTVKMEKSATLIGQGQAQDLKETVGNSEAGHVAFDCDISPRAQRNLEEILEKPVTDRQGIIIQIFATRAATREASLQVELARLHYMLPRLTGSYEELSRQQGGVKGTRGGGEAQIELDRRRISERIARLKEELKKVRSTRERQRAGRKNHDIPVGAIVGYTNSGKSSLLKALSGAEILVEDKLFATLDPTTRRIKLPESGEVLLSDTVGFVSNLPHHLVDAFRSTLEEAAQADFLIIVCDASHPDMMACYHTTLEVLHELEADVKSIITLLNKMDAPAEEFAVARLQSTAQKVIPASVKTGMGLDSLLDAIGETAYSTYPPIAYSLPADRHDLVALARRSGRIEHLSYEEESINMTARIVPSRRGELAPFAL